jgi:hypothetical protein
MKGSSRKAIGLIAGEGRFPFLVAQGIRQQGYQVFVAGFRNHTSEKLYPLADRMVWLRLGQLGKLLSFFKRNNVDQVIFAGPINKPKALGMIPDFRAARLLFRVGSKHDGEIFQALIRTLDNEGIEVLSPLSFVPALKTPEGILGRRKPSKNEEADISFGWPLAKEIGNLDIGQCIVVKDNIVIAVEAVEGSDATILRAGELAGPGCVVIKVFKPGQAETIDQPAVGLQTIRTMIQSGATCLALEAEECLFFDRQDAVDLADEHDIAIIGYSPHGKESE